MARKAESKPRAGTTTAAVEAMRQAAGGWPAPPVKFAAAERKVWDAVMIARLPQQWAQVDLLVAVNLTRALTEIEAQRALLDREGDIVEGRLNPRHRLVETLNRRVLAQMRLLQIHAVAATGPKREQAGAKGEAEAAAAALQKAKVGAKTKPDFNSDDLLARPRLQ
jgi:hypothetical protein